MSDQIAIPVEVPLPEIERKKSLGQALVMCMELAGFDQDKAVPVKGLDAGQFSRWKSGQDGIKWEKFAALMDGCGNDAPLLWMLHQRGYYPYGGKRAFLYFCGICWNRIRAKKNGGVT